MRKTTTTTRWGLLIAACASAALLVAASPASALAPSSSQAPKPGQSSSTVLTVDPVAHLSGFVSYVEVTGTLSCPEGDFVTVIVDIRQRAKGQEIGTVAFEDFACSGGTWSMLLRSDAGEIGGPQFKPGKAEVVAGAFICDPEECTIEEARATIQILP